VAFPFPPWRRSSRPFFLRHAGERQQKQQPSTPLQRHPTLHLATKKKKGKTKIIAASLPLASTHPIHKTVGTQLFVNSSAAPPSG